MSLYFPVERFEIGIRIYPRRFLGRIDVNGATTTMIAPIINTENQTVLLPVEIWLGGIKLRMKASNEPQKPRPPTNHIKPLPDLPIRNGRFSFFILYRNAIAPENINRYIIR